MRRFQFRLERFLELRRWKERECEIALAKVLGECLVLERRIADIAVEVSASFFTVFTTGGAVDIGTMARRELYVLRLAQERERTEATLAEKRVELEEVRAKYVEAARARKVLDKLKERRADDYYERQLDEEFKTVDEINTAAQSRRDVTAPAGA
ncbi:MAG TPA: flagellar export protein FliJ [Spirochaetia bacterium]|nr:flagellar export protein FliJ [Spirochaetia bacterium]